MAARKDKTNTAGQFQKGDPNRYTESYIVEECPLFEDDTDQYNKPVRRNKWNSAPYLQEVDAGIRESLGRRMVWQ